MKKALYGIIAALALALLAGAAISPVQAHGVELLRSDPADGATLAAVPAAVQAWFSAELAAGGSFMQVVDPAGTPVDLGDGGLDPADATRTSMRVSLPQGLPNGTYVVKWQATLPDGDTVIGTFQFIVGAAPYPAAAPADASTGSKAQPESAAPYPAGSPQVAAGDNTPNAIEKIFQDRNSLIGAGIGGLAILLGLLVLIRKLTANRD